MKTTFICSYCFTVYPSHNTRRNQAKGFLQYSLKRQYGGLIASNTCSTHTISSFNQPHQAYAHHLKQNVRTPECCKTPQHGPIHSICSTTLTKMCTPPEFCKTQQHAWKTVNIRIKATVISACGKPDIVKNLQRVVVAACSSSVPGLHTLSWVPWMFLQAPALVQV